MRAKEFTKPSAAGCILYAEDTGRYGLQQRSDTVDAPGLWAAWGGSIEPGETLEQCVLRELAEESGYHGAIKLHPLAKTAKYVTFIGVVPHEFEPEPCDEWKDFCWVEPGNWPSPMHPGTAAALQQNNTTKKLNEKINQKVVEPGFTAEKWIGGRYLLKAEARTTDDHNDHLRGLIIKAYDSDAKSYVARSWGIGMVRFIARQDKQTGEWRMVSSSTQVSNEYQRQGIASAMYQWARELGNDIEPSDTRTDQGKYFWKQGAGVGREYDHQPPVAKQPEPTAEPVAKPAKPLSLKDRLLKAFNENLAEGSQSNRISFRVQKGKNKFATTMAVNNKQVGVYQYDATTGRSIAEVYPEFKGKGFGKLLVLNAIYTAAKLGLDFQEDESRTSEYDNVLDSLSSNGYIVDDNGYWYVTSDGEQYLTQSLKQGVAENFADGKNPGRKGLSKRVGIPKKASLSQLQKIAGSSTGERRRMAQWQLNMRRGKSGRKK